MAKKTVWKFPLTPDEPHFPARKIVTLAIPEDSEVMSVRTINERPFLWVLTSGNSPLVERRFLLLGTGHEAEMGPEDYFIDTYLSPTGSYVNHVFTYHGEVTTPQ